MSNVYLYTPTSPQLDGFGLLGAVPCKDCTFSDVANDSSTVTMNLMIDESNLHRYIKPKYILAVTVPMLTPPIIDESTNQIATSIQLWRVIADTDKEDRQLHRSYNPVTGVIFGNGKVLDGGTEVAVIQSSYDWDYWKVRSNKTSGWIKRDALTSERVVTKAATTKAIEEELGATTRVQYFRIKSVSRKLDGITVEAEHITYDLIGNVTNCEITEPVIASRAVKEIVGNCVFPDHGFTAYSNATDELTNAAYSGHNPINALLDDKGGVIADIGDAALLRDNFDLYLISNASIYRGMRIEYGLNMKGLEFIEDWSGVVTHVIPVGKTSAGKPAYLPLTTAQAVEDEYYLGIDPDMPEWFGTVSIGYLKGHHSEMLAEEERGEETEYTNLYPTPNIEFLDTELQVSDTMSTSQMRIRMRQKAIDRFLIDNCDQPKLWLSVEFAMLGDSDRTYYMKNVENVRLFDVVRIINKVHGIDTMAMCTEIEWDCLGDKMLRAVFETVQTEKRYSASDGIFIPADAEQYFVSTYSLMEG